MQKVSAALVKAQKAFGPALKSSTNPHFKSRYADLSACVEAVIDALNENGIALIQRNIETESGVCVETVFVHESGESLSSGPLHVPAAKQDPQGYGSALTYARRYSLMAACGIAPEDDDGNAATSAKNAQKPTSKPDPAQEVINGVKAGDASGAATYLAGLSESAMNAIWAKLPADIQDKLTAAWPA
jgi:hypothetical protein